MRRVAAVLSSVQEPGDSLQRSDLLRSGVVAAWQKAATLREQGSTVMTTDVGTSGTNGAVTEMRPWERFTAFLQREAEENKGSAGDELTANAVDAILTAETEDAIWDADELGLVALQNLVGAEIEVRDFKILPSNNPEMCNKFGVFMIMNIVMLTEFRTLQLQPGDEVTANTGVETVIAKLKAFKSKEISPVRALVQGIPTGNGTMVRLRPIPKRAIQAATAE